MVDELFDRSGVRYEIACDVIGALIAHYAEIIAEEERRERPDPAIIADGATRQRELRDQRELLDPRDRGAIEEIISALGPLARTLYGK